MIAKTAALDASEPAGASPTGSPARQLWQVPVFLLGVTTLLLVVCHRPCSGDCSKKDLDHKLDHVRHLLTHNKAEEALALAREAVEQSERLPDRLGEAWFLLGSAEMRLADHLDLKLRTAHYQSARTALEKARTLGVAEKDQPKLLFCLGKVLFHTAGDPRQVVALLAPTVDQCDDMVDGYCILTEAYLREQPPDLKSALGANDKLRALAVVPPEILERAKLKGGETEAVAESAGRRPQGPGEDRRQCPAERAGSRSGAARPDLQGRGTLE